MFVISTLKALRGLVLLAVALLLFTGAVVAQAPAWQWGLQSTNPVPTDNTTAGGIAVATDAAGRAYVGGWQGSSFAASATPVRSFGGAGSTVPGRTGFVAQATPAGQWAWLLSVVPTGANTTNGYYTQVTGMATTAAGDVYAAGTVLGTALSIGGQTQAVSGNSLPASGMFVARFSSAGVCQWVRVTAVNAGGFDAPALAPDPSTGGVVVAGSYSGTPVFGATTLPASTASGALFVARLSAAGQWLGAAGATGSAGLATDVTVAVGPAGQVAVAGSQRAGTLAFGSTTLTVPTGAYQSYVVAQLSPANQWQWAVGGGPSSEGSWAIGAAYTPAGILWVSGRGPNGTVLGATTLTLPFSSSLISEVGFLGQLSATGQWARVQQLAPSADGFAVCGPLAVDGAGIPYFMGGLGGYGGPVQATLGTQTLASTTAMPLLLFVARLSSAGQLQYVATVPAPAIGNGLSPQSIVLDASGSLYFTGSFRGGLALGSSVLSGSYSPSAAYPGSGDVVLGKLLNATALAARPALAAPTLACYPNPARTAATVALPPAAAGPVVLADALGRPVRTCPVAAHAASVALDLTGLAPGLYLVRCGAATGRLVVE